jgi:predicted RecA/RadA family phage recombinase
MPDFLPKYEDADRLTYIAGGTIVGGNVVEFTAANTVSASTGVSSKVAGIALFDATVGQQITITRTGVCELVTTSNVAVGDHVTSSTGGGVAPIGAGTFVQDIGVASTAATSPAAVAVLLHLQ